MILFRLFKPSYLFYIVFFLGLFSWVLAPAFVWLTRDKQYDAVNMVKFGDTLDVSLYAAYGKNPHQTLQKQVLLYRNESVPYAKKKYVIKDSFSIPITPEVRLNKSNVFLFIVVKQNDCPSDQCFSASEYSQIVKWYIPSPKKSHILANSVKSEPTPTPEPSQTPAPFRYKTVRFDLVAEQIYNRNCVSPFIQGKIAFNSRKNIFRPPLLEDKFFEIKSERRGINLTNDNFSISVEFNMRGDFIWSFKILLSTSLALSESLFNFDFLTHEVNIIKSIFIEANYLLLWTTGIATILHTFFQMLAFEKDIEFWAKKESLVGVSLRTIVIQLISQVIEFLCLIEYTNIPLLKKIIQNFSIVINLWKIFKLIKLSRRFPFIKIRKSYRGNTDDADATGTKYFIFVLIPLVLIYSLYQFFYVEYTSVKSYIIHCATGAIYAFDFLTMLPQLYINYKLKTVAGMSRSAFGYKFISTFIDDLYTFLSNLPLIYKIACFRDDVVFFIWIIQCFIYPVDPSRVNEFGFIEKSQLEEKNEKEEKEKEEEEEESGEGKEKLKDEKSGKVKTD
ncbi:CLPTM1-like membrane protein cnrB [Tritrichomonas foetus]|uniref:CLPTM1-like membrane protein cnrB n=1 Tax=Tritrichomonas foetus TaxID=1144522 RepID=A0A1J4J6W3_9EUKA|nr:CLPTM1-like membrane protein cnrB [Tritrichomonas foetus]|eukprot:OHS93173.1 CLPTM1-like membrane protein cnrB [Tritrichomonas foetus]